MEGWLIAPWLFFFFLLQAHQMSGNLPWHMTSEPAFICDSPLGMAKPFPTEPVLCQVAVPSSWPEWPSDRTTCPLQSLSTRCPIWPCIWAISPISPPPVLIICWWKDTLANRLANILPDTCYGFFSPHILSTHLSFSAVTAPACLREEMPFQICSPRSSEFSKSRSKHSEDNIDPRWSREGV